MIHLIIPGKPVPWASHRGTGRRSFNPRFREKEYVQWQVRSQYDGQPVSYPIFLIAEFYIPIPKGFSKAKRDAAIKMELFPDKRPDRGNYEKFICDCLTGLVWVDDSQVIDGPVRKLYGEKPRTDIKIFPMNEITITKTLTNLNT
jgi:Holliday junction resolvase RusA-like endonuclease